MRHEIRCADGCGSVLGSVKTNKAYKGDRHYGMLCAGCAEKRRVAAETRRHRIEAVQRKVADSAHLTPEERDILLGGGSGIGI